MVNPIDIAAPQGVETLSRGEYAAFRDLIHEVTGISLGPNKQHLLGTRLRKRMRAIGLSSYSEYLDRVTDRVAYPGELEELINCVTTNKTDFFRERHHFDFLRDEVFGKIVKKSKQTGSKKLRIWSAACSIGAEPYSIAMTAAEFFGNHTGWDTRILASDIDSKCLSTAAAGQYPESMADLVPEGLRERYLLRGAGSAAGKVAVKPSLKEMIAFRRINFAEPSWPINTKFDVIFCRNALIYFDRTFQEKLIRRFMSYLAPGGYLILGHSENISWIPELEPLGKTIYRPREGCVSGPAFEAKERPPVRSKPKKNKPKRRPIIAGEMFASKDPVQITTLLGSCIAACLYDPEVKVGGMNHFLLPDGHQRDGDGACYGINAMELLINELMMRGGDRNRMVARLYGGGNLMSGKLKSSCVGKKNIDFVRKYLATEGIPILSQKVGGRKAMHVSMTANTGEVVAKELDDRSSTRVTAHDNTASQAATATSRQPDTDQITLF